MRRYLSAIALALIAMSLSAFADSGSEPVDYSCFKQEDFAGFPTLLELQLTLSDLSANTPSALVEFRMTNLDYPPPKGAWHVLCSSFGPMTVKKNASSFELEGRVACVDGTMTQLNLFFNSQTLEVTNGEAGDTPYKCMQLAPSAPKVR